MVIASELDSSPLAEDAYSWVKEDGRSIPSLFVDMEGVRRLGAPSLWVRDGKNVAVKFLPCLPTERVCHKGSDASWFFMYTFVLAEVSVRFPFTEFECSVLRKLNCAPRRVWIGYMGDVELSPRSYSVLNFSEMFPLYCNKSPVQCLVEDLFEKDATLSEFLFENLKGGKILTTSVLLKWDSDRSDVVKYLETKVPDCSTIGLKSFFKQRAEKELSTSHVVKVEQGSEVNKPSERRKPISMKRMRMEDSASKKVIYPTDGKCCNKDASLEEVANFTRSQAELHGFVGAKDLSSVWCEHYPFAVVADEHFQSKVDLDFFGKVGKVGATRYMQLKKRLKIASEQVFLKEKELDLLKEENEDLKNKVSKFSNDKKDLEGRVVELCGEKKEAKVSKKDHGCEMFAIAWERAKALAELLAPGVKLDKMDPAKVVYKGELIDDDQVPGEGGDDHNPAE
ncbi:hypothetical protein PIB30_085334 [Stylosanthes scabra]|uniref:Uncharacterized protein n=1 Tax=Stylosanthes scabra TaxID=79078 RepID=A0ABU6RSP3_9FABA|nr:hypothetical protein [Stylosanthes scabra]